MRGSLFSFCNMCSGIRRGKIPAQNLHLRLRMKSTADNTAAVSRNAGVELAGDVLPLLTVDNILEIECVSGVESDAELEEVAAYCAVGLAEVDECEGVGLSLIHICTLVTSVVIRVIMLDTENLSIFANE